MFYNFSFLWVMAFLLIISKFQALDFSDIQIDKMDSTFSTKGVIKIIDKKLIIIWINNSLFYPNHEYSNFNQLQNAISVLSHENVNTGDEAHGWKFFNFSNKNTHSLILISSVYALLRYFKGITSL